MYCSKCGNQIPEETGICPACSPAENSSGKPFIKAPSKFSKSYAAIFTALLVFPATVCTAIDFAFDRYDYWFGYVVGALAVTWVLSVLPVLRITRPAVTAIICFGSIIAYMFFIVHKTGEHMWLSKFVLPMFILTAALISIDVSVIGAKKIKGLHILSLLSLECAAFLVCLEATLDNWLTGAVDIKWSIILACGFISVVAVLEAFSYIIKINKK